MIKYIDKVKINDTVKDHLYYKDKGKIQVWYVNQFPLPIGLMCISV